MKYLRDCNSSVWVQRARLLVFLVAMGYPVVGALVVAMTPGPGGTSV